MPFKVGEIVKYLNEKGGGKVLKLISPNEVEVEDEEGFVFRMKTSELVSQTKSTVDEKEIKEKLSQFTPNISAKQGKAGAEANYQSKVKEYLMLSKLNWTTRDQNFIEIDLHIEEIIEKPGRLSDGEKLNHQLKYAGNCLNAAIDLRIQRIVFIHGVGTGVLKAELRKWLSTFSNIEFKDGRHRSYGMGATEVIVKGYYN